MRTYGSSKWTIITCCYLLQIVLYKNKQQAILYIVIIFTMLEIRYKHFDSLACSIGKVLIFFAARGAQKQYCKSWQLSSVQE